MRNWSDIPGATATGSINLVVRTAASGTQDAFQKIFMGSKTVSSSLAAKAWALLQDAGAELALSGHDHDYERFALQSPSGAAEMSTSASPGSPPARSRRCIWCRS